jgi:hypothetical protein
VGVDVRVLVDGLWGFPLPTRDSWTNGNAKTVFIGVGIGIAIGVELLKADTDSDSDPDPDFSPIVTDYSIRLGRRRV